jgi:cholesterol oxidase
MKNANFSRRDFLRTTLAAGAAVFGTSRMEGALAAWAENRTSGLSRLLYYGLVPELFNQVSRPPAYTRNLIIGSGFGGAISALRLAQAGEPVTVLERGFKWPNSPRRNIFATDTIPDGWAFWFKTRVAMLSGLEAWMDAFGGVMDATEYENMTVWRGACVGGGSVIFTGVMIQPDREYFDALIQGRLGYEEMEKVYYPRVRRMLNLSSMPEDIYQSGPFGHSRAWDDHVRMAGYAPCRIDSIFNWSVIRAELDGRARKSARAVVYS